MAKLVQHTGDYHVLSRRLVKRARCMPPNMVICWRCRRTLADHPQHKTGRTVGWTAGHVERARWADINHDPMILSVWSAHGLMAVEASTCNYTDGAVRGKAQRAPLTTTRAW